jgi:membrane protein implicated in regulation of membrane protease activity
MSEEKHEKTYPVRTLHDFLSELDREWSKFRTGSLVSMIASGVLLVFFVLRFLLLALKRLDVMDTMFLVFVAIFLIYSIYALIGQYRFFNKWERRMGLLLHLEEELMNEKLGD